MSVLAAGLVSGPRAAAQTLPAGFRDTTVFSGLDKPTAVCFASDGVFVAEKSGLIKVFASLAATTPTIFADLRTSVHNYWDRGLLGMALHPDFPATPFLYVLYTHDAAIGGTAPRWGTAGYTSDTCPTPPGGTGDGCVVSGRLSRLEAAGSVSTGSELALIEDWFQQYPSHSLGSLLFGSDGALYASAGDGAGFNFTDYGQDGNPLNPGGDPPVGIGGVQTPPTAEGGALRSQDLRTSGDPVTLDGAIIRVDAATGAGLPDNPLAGNPDENARRVLAYGLRNPFRFTLRPGTNEVWVGDVGKSSWEEINRIANATDSAVENFGWPCYEGPNTQPSYNAADLDICEQLYAAPSIHAPPYYTYYHGDQVVPGEPCPSGSAAISGLAFYAGSAYPAGYQGALFFADYSRNCMWTMLPGAGGEPDPANRQTFVAGAASPVQLLTGPGGDLFYVDIMGGKLHRIQYFTPTAVAMATPSTGPAPLTVQFDATGSSHPDPMETLSYSWDLNGDGTFGDSTMAQPSYTYTVPGSYPVRVRVTDTHGGSDTATVPVDVANAPPTATIGAPLLNTTWRVGTLISFSGSASDAQDGTLPASSLSWSFILHHCPSGCHAHSVQDFPGVASGSFTAEDHEYPSYLELKLTATDSGGLQDTESVLLYPETVVLSFESSPMGLSLVLDSPQITPFTRTVIVGSTNSLSAPSPQTQGLAIYDYVSWSDGGAQSHDITGGTAPATYLATYTARAGPLDFYTIAPCRVADTQNPDGPFGGPALSAGTGRTFIIANQCGIPPTARAVSMNVTVTQPAASGHLRLFPAGTPLPLASSINYGAGQTRASNGILSLGRGSDFVAHCTQESGTVHFILDVNGYFE